MTCYRLAGQTPEIAETAFVAREATVIGNVRLGEQVSVWPGAVIRGDNDLISIGNRSNVQEGAVLHTDPGIPLTIGENVTVGHQAMLHGCTVGDGALIGIQAVVLNGAVIGKESLVGAGAIVTEGKVFPERSLILGAPAKVVRTLTDEDVARMARGTAGYAAKSAVFRTELEAID
ncbi:gamma carbonic anhydrase family protein [Achromobacter sp. GG226]|uniref:gamma carbonic anhydrase family protein n=1 Tax=Verticiella alkaliphila TaxID=2779529 RepID=UPI001C0DCCE6|nr:gamma carbonic anhydrase family protein [Verticiella sp. GG226]MBU4609622.1 gamma carbonic anhydrase family protein [Verticiella sp. GG226]